MKLCEALATLLTIAGFFLISENILIAGFTIALVSNILWLVWASDSGAKGIFLVNGVMLLVSLNGLINNF